jgi:hypothetical protein
MDPLAQQEEFARRLYEAFGAARQEAGIGAPPRPEFHQLPTAEWKAWVRFAGKVKALAPNDP